ncbi:amidase [Rugosimonospora acidiphila]|uniref:Amidase n=1 Tax=Rugosimonospora acidiphila TaxID=556531 RepID=A0ABP9SF72_9ACTN
MWNESGSWVGATAKEISRAVRRGDTSATQVLADHLDYIRAQQPVVNAFRVLRPEAVAEAEAVDEQEDLGELPLAGVPIAVKENTAVAGLPTWGGSATVRGAVAETDHEVVRRLRGAGAVVVATSRMPELGLWPMTDDETAVTRNPWRTDRTPGGSSGGAAAAVAAGLVPIAHGNDGLGSVRIPAACCGLVGIKPGRGVVPAQMSAGDWFGLAEHGILATTVADATVGLAVLAGWQPPRLTEPTHLRVAVSARSPVLGAGADQPARAALASAARLLTGAGHETVEASPPYSTRLGLRGLATWFAAAHRDVTEAGLDVAALQPRTRRHVAIGGWVQRRGLVRDRDREDWRAQCEQWFAGGYDALLTPALAGSPPPAEDWRERPWRSNLLTSVRYAPFAAPWNLAGLPAVVVPMGVRPDGLPVAVQLVGPPGSELTLLGLAGQLEQASPWLRHAPGWPRRESATPATDRTAG